MCCAATQRSALLLSTILVHVSGASESTAATIANAPLQLLTDWRLTPVLGVESRTPVFRWAAPPTALTQASARVLVYATEAATLVWNISLQQSEQAATYGGVPLLPSTAYAWAVQTTDALGVTSSFSANATFITGVFDSWSAVPIWSPNASSQFVFFRTEAALPSNAISNAVLSVTANPGPSSHGEAENAKLLGAYRLFVNGELIGLGPGRPGRCGPVCPVGGGKGPCTCTPEHVYDSYNVADVLRRGSSSSTARNDDCLVTLAVQAFNYAPADSKILLHLVVSFTDGSSRITVGTGTDWRTHQADNYINASCCTASQWFLAPRENFDNTHEPVGWRTLGFDDSAWELAAQAPPFSAPLIARPTLPLSVEQGVVPAFIEQRAPGHYFIDFGKEFQGGVTVNYTNATDSDRVVARFGEALLPDGSVMYQMSTGNSYWMTWTLRSAANQVVETHEYLEFRYLELLAPVPPEYQCAVSDPGDYTGAINLICAAPGATISRVTFASWGTPRGNCTDGGPPGANSFAVNPACDAAGASAVIAALCVGRAQCSFVPSDALLSNGTDPCRGTKKWLAAAVDCTPGTAAPAAAPTAVTSSPGWAPDIRGWRLTYPAAYVPHQVALDSEPLMAVWELSQYTVVATDLDMFTDSNTRQRSVICSEALLINIMMQYAVSLEFAQQTYTLDYVLNHRPHNLGWAEWGALSIFAVHAVWIHTGDLAMFIARYEQLRNFTELSLVATNSSGLWTCDAAHSYDCHQPEIDWPAGMRDGFVAVNADTIVNGYTARAMSLFSMMAAQAGGHDGDVALFNVTARAITTHVNAELWNETTGSYMDGLGTSHSAWHTDLYLLAFGLVPSDRADRVWAHVTQRSIGTPGLCNPGNVYPAYWALEAFYANTSDFGHAGLAYMTCNGTNSWLAMIRQGATTTMEAWDPEEKPNLTWSHPWAASPAAAILRWLFGIRPVAPGFASIVVQPQPGSLRWGNATLPSIRGRIAVSFTQTFSGDGDRFPSSFRMNVTVPGAVVARICLPLSACGGPSVVLDGGAVVAEVEGAYACVVGVGAGVHVAACGAQ